MTYSDIWNSFMFWLYGKFDVFEQIPNPTLRMVFVGSLGFCFGIIFSFIWLELKRYIFED